nr:MAG TPA: hypothetical protein [Caudoviricetes sp.]
MGHIRINRNIRIFLFFVVNNIDSHTKYRRNCQF